MKNELPAYILISLFLACEDKKAEKVEDPNFDTPDWTDETHGKKADPNYHVVFPSNKVNRMDVIFRSGAGTRTPDTRIMIPVL